MARNRSSSFNAAAGFDYTEKPVEKKAPEVKKIVENKPKKEKEKKESSVLVNVTDKSKVGRPKQEGEYKNVSARLKLENYEHARLVGGKYGGVTAYINYLIEQDMK